MQLTALNRALTIGAIAVLLAACRSGQNQAQPTAIEPADFMTPPADASANPVTRPQTPRTASDAQPANADQTDEPDPELPERPAMSPDDLADRTFVVDAMVGQVNGKPIYASIVFAEIGTEELELLGRVNTRGRFRDSAFRLIYLKLREIVENAVILAEAERGLSQHQHLALLGMLEKEREKIIADYGKGSLKLARENLFREKGVTIEEELANRRKKALSDQYVRTKILPHIRIYDRAVKNYYQDHPEQFNPAPSVTVRIMTVSTTSSAVAVDEALAAGEPFEDVAAQFSNLHREDGGFVLTVQTPLAEFAEVAWPELNEAVRPLKPGQHSGRVTLEDSYGWIKLEQLEQSQTQTLEEVYLAIEEELKVARFRKESFKYMAGLLSRSSYTPIEQMADALLNVAMSRYANPR